MASAASEDVGGPGYAPSLQDQLDGGFPGMRFKPALEQAYRHQQFHDSRRYLRINLVMLFVLVLAIVQVDRLVIPAFSQSVPAVARLSVMVPILVTALALSFLRGAPTWYPRIMTALMTIALMAIAWIGLLAWSHGEDRVFVRLVIATMALYFVLGLRFRLALAANLVSMSFYAAAAVAWDMPALELAQFLAMLLMTSVICAAGAYNLEHARRTAWLEGRLLHEIARRDGLTGIHNRRRFDEHLNQVWQQCLRDRKPIALLLADIDCFKAYNDHYGHQAGDEALKAVASVHARFGLRPLDMAARFGGEEFAVVLFDVGPADALRIGQEIREAVRGLGIAHARSTAAPMLTISIGIACVVPETRRSAAGLLQLADHALYAAKDSGGNTARLLDAAHDDMETGYFRRARSAPAPQ